MASNRSMSEIEGQVLRFQYQRAFAEALLDCGHMPRPGERREARLLEAEETARRAVKAQRPDIAPEIIDAFVKEDVYSPLYHEDRRLIDRVKGLGSVEVRRFAERLLEETSEFFGVGTSDLLTVLGDGIAKLAKEGLSSHQLSLVSASGLRPSQEVRLFLETFEARTGIRIEELREQIGNPDVSNKGYLMYKEECEQSFRRKLWDALRLFQNI